MPSRISPTTKLAYLLLLTNSTRGFLHCSSILSRHSSSHVFNGMSHWDSENGVWSGDMATSDDEIPSPLYLFGYGSLLWRPGYLLSDYPSYSCTCSGWKRLFAQRSSDHRGSPEFPGLVATLVQATYFDSVTQETGREITEPLSQSVDGGLNGIINCSRGGKRISTMKCAGLVWLIPDDRIEATIADLDFRERGGYHRHLIDITLDEDTDDHLSGTTIRALVYSGSTDNPNFLLMGDGAELGHIIDKKNEAGRKINRSRSVTADIIAAAVGPSGPNSEYLFKLNEFMRLNGLDDEYVANLSDSVAFRMGPWRARKELFLTSNHGKNQPVSTDASVAFSKDNVRERDQALVSDNLQTCIASGMLMGWGSNEYMQLGTHTQLSDAILQLQATCNVIQLRQEASSKSVTNDDVKESGTIGPGSSPLTSKIGTGTCDKSHSIITHDRNADAQQLQLQLKRCQVLCGAAYSAFLCPLGVLSLWGKYAKNFLNQSVAVDDTESSPIREVETIRDIVGAALGYEHILLLCKSGWVLALGDDNWGQCEGPRSFVRAGNLGPQSTLTQTGCDIDKAETVLLQGGLSEPAIQVLKLAAGVRHSAAITMDGWLHVWGSGGAARIAASPSLTASFTADIPATVENDIIGQQAPSPEVSSPIPVTNCTWRPTHSKLIDVSCGLHHTVAVDDMGRVWSFGDNKFGSLGRPATVSIPNALTSRAVDSVEESSYRGSAGVKGDISKTSETKVIEEEKFEKSYVKKERKGKDRPSSQDSVPRLVEGLEPGVRWQRVSCGWSHTVVRGIRPDGTLASAAWGRRNFGQYPMSDSRGLEVVCEDKGDTGVGTDEENMGEKIAESSVSQSTSSSNQRPRNESVHPQELKLPHGVCVREVWAGSEFTIVADDHGYLWASGWNAHGNLGRGSVCSFESSDGWVKVMTTPQSGDALGVGQEGIPDVKTDSSRGSDDIEKGSGSGQHVRLSTIWEGALSCGGGHVLCLTDMDSGS